MKNYKAFESLINGLIEHDEELHADNPVQAAIYAWGWLEKDEENHEYEIGPRFTETIYSPEEIIQCSQACGLNCYLTIATNEEGNDCVAIHCF